MSISDKQSPKSILQTQPIQINTTFQLTQKPLNKCFVCGCVRNVAKYLPAVFQNIRKLQTVFDEICILMAYDDSDDNTLDLLKSIQKTTPRFYIIVLTEPLSDIRTKNIANARNGILQEIQHLQDTKPEFREYSYFCMIDMDNVCAGKINADILPQYLERTDWDALSFYRETYYDIWALSIRPFVFSCWHWYNREIALNVIETTQSYFYKKIRELPKNELLEVDSAFCGFGLYRLSKFIDCEYSPRFALPYMSSKMLAENERALQLPLMPEYREFYGDCEHRWFHMEAIHKHGAKIRVSPLALFDVIP